MSVFIKKLHIRGFKSLDDLRVENMGYFSVFAGANGSGKSNFFDALDFVGQFIRNGVEAAVNQQGGYQHFRPAKSSENTAVKFHFELACDLDDKHYQYSLVLNNLEGRASFDGKAGIEENLEIDGKLSLSRKWRSKPIIEGQEQSLSDNHSALLLYDNLPLREFLTNLRIYRIQPLRAAQANRGAEDSSVLQRDGSNLASVLQRLERDKNTREQIMEWMEMIVSGLEKISIGRKNLTKTTGISFKEVGTKEFFPANMVSDGTMYLLCLLVAIFDAPKEYGMILLEEPEQGLHPKAIQEMVELMRESAHERSPIWITTHSEAIVRQLQLHEFWMVNKNLGRTTLKHASDGRLTDDDLAPLSLDELWLSNLFDGGVPW